MQIPIVNEQDEIIGYRDRSNRDPKEIFRATGLWVTDPDGNILLAQRAMSKVNDPGKWGPAVAGTVEEGETYESNIIKEAEEEIGLKNIKPELSYKILTNTGHKFFGQWFTLVIDRDTALRIEEDEVEKVQWFSPDELIKLFSENRDIFLINFNQTMKYFLNYENQN